MPMGKVSSDRSQSRYNRINSLESKLVVLPSPRSSITKSKVQLCAPQQGWCGFARQIRSPKIPPRRLKAGRSAWRGSLDGKRA